jgi:hypothetical protein
MESSALGHVLLYFAQSRLRLAFQLSGTFSGERYIDRVPFSFLPVHYSDRK